MCRLTRKFCVDYIDWITFLAILVVHFGRYRSRELEKHLTQVKIRLIFTGVWEKTLLLLGMFGRKNWIHKRNRISISIQKCFNVTRENVASWQTITGENRYVKMVVNITRNVEKILGQKKIWRVFTIQTCLLFPNIEKRVVPQKIGDKSGNFLINWSNI